jgi:hypothetical protein
MPHVMWATSLQDVVLSHYFIKAAHVTWVWLSK